MYKLVFCFPKPNSLSFLAYHQEIGVGEKNGVVPAAFEPGPLTNQPQPTSACAHMDVRLMT